METIYKSAITLFSEGESPKLSLYGESYIGKIFELVRKFPLFNSMTMTKKNVLKY
jgi:hypothetical protein